MSGFIPTHLTFISCIFFYQMNQKNHLGYHNIPLLFIASTHLSKLPNSFSHSKQKSKQIIGQKYIIHLKKGISAEKFLPNRFNIRLAFNMRSSMFSPLLYERCSRA